MPDYDDTEECIVPKQFMWDVANTINSDLTSKIIDHARELRRQEVTEEDKTWEIAEDILELIEKSTYMSKRKGRALKMLTVSKNLKPKVRKTKRKYKILEVEE